MNNKPFPHPKALVDMKKSLIFDDDAAKISLKLLNESGIINVGGEPQSVYDFVKKHNPDVGKISLKDIKDVNMATNSTLDISKLKKMLSEK
jgi:hypothetical protein